MAGSIVSFAMANLWSLLKEEANLLYGVSDQINELCREFERMECFLQDAEARQHKEKRVRNWIREIRNLAFRAENIIENYAVEVSSSNEKGFKKVCKRFACILSEARTLHKIGIEIEDIKAKIAGVTRSLDTYGIKAVSQAESSNATTTTEKERWLRMTYPHEVVEDSFVGMKDDIKQLMSLIFDERRHPIVSIWGMGGSGKTTVARKIFNDERIKGHFDALAWVCISQQCQVRKVLEEIMQQLLYDSKRMEEIKLMGDVRLVGELYKQQKEKKCLVVLDDIWNVSDWDCLQSAFPNGEGQGKILLTSRNKKVAEIGFAHNLSDLTEDEGWELLQKKALITDYYRSVQDSNIEMEREKMGRKMVDKCGYLPLAISVIGGILRKKQSLDEWKKVDKDVEFYLSKGADENKGIMSILSLSYDVLPYHLKQCFLSIGHYPEDCEIGVLGLCFQWMGEGIVLSKCVGRGETLLEVAEEYLSELASRSMVKVSLFLETDVSGLKYKSCHLHDLMRELCLNKCSEEDFGKMVDFDGESKSEPFSIEQLHPYRLAICSHGYLDQKAHNTLTQIAQQQNSQHGYLRSLMFIDASIQGQPTQMESSWTQLFNNLKYLQILSFQRYKFVDKSTLQSIQKLIHLRFIFFQDCSMDEPPLQLLNLPYLQSILIRNLEWINPTKVANNVMWKAKRLRHLYFYVDQVDKEKKLVDQGKLRLRGLFQLQLLFGFNTGKMEATDLSELSNLRWFSASDISDNDSLYLILNCIEDNRWPHIQMVSLRISGCHLSSLKDDGNEDGIMTNSINLVSKVFSCRKLHFLIIDGSLGNKLPKYEPHIASCLTELSLRNYEIVEDPMETLEKLPNLTQLFLENAFVGQEMVCNKMGFPKLQLIVLDNLHNLEKWKIEEGSMCKLSRLEISGCEKLEMIPNGLRFVSTLKELTLKSMPLEFVRRIHSADQGNEGADFHKIRHLQSVYIL